jgi:hypothetical protein
VLRLVFLCVRLCVPALVPVRLPICCKAEPIDAAMRTLQRYPPHTPSFHPMHLSQFIPPSRRLAYASPADEISQVFFFPY